jgi:UDPglucose 6-dehydrogenase
LATKIAFINEIANLCERSHANVQDVAKAMGLDGRIGRKFLNAGPGYGGSCFPKDTNALAYIAREMHSTCSIIESVIASNQTRKKHMAQRILKHTDVQKVAILGVTFKPNTDDLRDAPSLDIIGELLKAKKDVCIYDPLYYKGSSYESLFPIKDVQFASDAYGAVANADAVIILTEWNEFRSLDLEKIATLMRQKRIFDFRNIYKNDEVFDFYYESIGRKTIN